MDFPTKTSSVKTKKKTNHINYYWEYTNFSDKTNLLTFPQLDHDFLPDLPYLWIPQITQVLTFLRKSSNSIIYEEFTQFQINK